jgi:hypothetical protein
MAHCHVPDIPLSERLGYDTGETAALIGVSVSHVYVLIERGDLQTVKVAGRRIVPRWAIEALLGYPIGALLGNRKPPVAGDSSSAALAAEAPSPETCDAIAKPPSRRKSAPARTTLKSRRRMPKAIADQLS